MGEVINLKYHLTNFHRYELPHPQLVWYNAALKRRGSLTFWIDESVLESWIVPNLSGKPGDGIRPPENNVNLACSGFGMQHSGYSP
jgi:hypothetical protein